MNVLLIGANGKLGSKIQEAIASRPNEFKVCGLLNSKNTGDFLKYVDQCEVIIDVSNPLATLEYLSVLEKNSKYIPYVIGCTGFTRLPAETAEVIQYAKKSAVLISENFSLAVSLLNKIISETAPLLNQQGYSAKITETHHAQKRDAPSGTAKRLAATLNSSGITSSIESLRIGEVIGEHSICFENEFESLTFVHTAKKRDLFAHGALNSALWLLNMKKSNNRGIFSMGDLMPMNFS